MNQCEHGRRRYTRRVFSNATAHVCVQCLDCLAVVKLPEHEMRPFIKLDDVPAGEKIHEWIEPDAVQGGLF